jgi:RNA polymerase sigma factor (sigma-70 family)
MAAGTGGGPGFPTTLGSALIGLRSAEEPARRRSWDALVAAYWKPVYKHVRLRWQKSRDDAEDLTQGFFTRAVEKNFLAVARFRTFLRTCLDRFVSNEEKARQRLKRGGGATPLALGPGIDFGAAEAELLRQPGPAPGSAASAAIDGADSSAEERFEREWRRSLFALAVEALQAECESSGRQVRFTIFERHDLCDGDEGERPSYAELARQTGLPVTTVTNHLSWARRELRRLVLERLAELTATDEEYRSEAGRLLGTAAR